MRVLFIGENIYKSRSGVVTVMKQMLDDASLKERVQFKVVFTTGDQYSMPKKLVGWFRAYIKFLYNLPFCSVIHVHHASDLNFWLSSVFIYFARLTDKKIVLHNHSADFHEFYARSSVRRRRAIVGTFGRAHANIILSKSWLNWYTSIAPDANWVLMPNAIDIPPGIKTKTLSKTEVNIVYLARIEERKGFFDLMNVLPALISQQRHCKVYIAGQGDTSASAELIRNQGLGDNVFFLGHINGAERNQLLLNSHFLVLPSYNEGLPMSVLEAMSYASVPITTRVGGIPELVTDNVNGVLFEAGDRQALLSGMLSVLGDDARYERMSKNAREVVSANFNIIQYKDKMMDLYEALAGTKEYLNSAQS